jgi:hypothetical protein
VKLFRLLTPVFVILGYSVFGQDVIERDYFPNARAKNAAIAAARYAEEGYYYTKFTAYITTIDSSRLFADTALFFLKRALMLSDTSFHYVPKTNYPAVDFLRSGQANVFVADSVIHGFYPMIEVKSHRYFGNEASLHLSKAVMDFFNASLLIKSGNTDKVDDYEVLPFEDEIVRLEADEASFQHAANAYEEEIADYEAMYAKMEAELNQISDPEEARSLEKTKAELKVRLDRSVDRLEDLSHRIEEIRELLNSKYLRDVKDVKAPEYISQFERSGGGAISMNEEIPEGLVYKIQLGYYPEDVDRENFRGLFPVTGETVKKGLARFYAGLFFSYADASVGNDYIRENVIPNAFVVPFFNGNKISMSRAVEIERQRDRE